MVEASNLVDAVNLSQKRCPHPIMVDLKYATTDNFIGKPLPGYDANVTNLCIMTPLAAAALCEIQTYVNQQQLSLLVFDAYRPLRTVQYFTEWFENPILTETELIRKKLHYPHLQKTDLPRLGYIAIHVSRHCFGFAVDLTLVNLKNYKELNMGTFFDYFDSQSSAQATSAEIGQEAFENRQFLAKIMQQFGFLPYEEEFWHYDYKIREASKPFDKVIDNNLKEKLYQCSIIY
ncbi:MAG: hypothetical protein A3E87_09055 [Gammaproteobacteria bacterium RIFCSPHIGHO2_12_FULL_35_23]|nr:MAG: hypothetical protein A3E87_09055 [Gammaproteobacteria bacterium RIFCSPHIGHO2_12_FULL_35_23]